EPGTVSSRSTITARRHRNGPPGTASTSYSAAPIPHRSRTEELAEEFNYPQSAAVTATPGPTPSQTVGPFFHYALPYESGPAVVGRQRHGAFQLSGRVVDGQGEPIPDSLVEVWQADEWGTLTQEHGIYDEPEGTGFRGFGRSATNEAGQYGF